MTPARAGWLVGALSALGSAGACSSSSAGLATSGQAVSCGPGMYISEGVCVEFPAFPDVVMYAEDADDVSDTASENVGAEDGSPHDATTQTDVGASDGDASAESEAASSSDF